MPGRHQSSESRSALPWVLLVVVLLMIAAGVGVGLATRGSSHAGRATPSSAGPSTPPPSSQSAPVSSAPVSSSPPASSSSSSSPTSPTTTAAPAPTSVTVAFTGDTLPSDNLQAQALKDGGGASYDFKPMLAKIAPLLRSADWAICHQETPISDNDTGLAGYPDFNAPHELAADERWAGYDACDTASNHTMDLGAGGVTATLDSLDAAGIRHTGSARSATEAAKLAIYDVKGIKIGHIAYTYGLNDHTAPQSWMVNLIDVAKIKAAAHALKQAGADVVVVSLHAGTEYDQTPSDYQVSIDNQIMSSPDVDLIVGAHSHVVQPVKRLADGRWIIYGVGNFLAQQDDPTPTNRDGVIMEATFTKADGKTTLTRMGYVPTYVDEPSDVIELAPPVPRLRTITALEAMHAPLVDLTPH